MKKYIVLILVVAFLLSFKTVFASTVVSEPITEDTTWGAEGSPYIIENEIDVDSEATVKIDPGVIVKFKQSSALIVHGKLDAIGTENNPIYFTSIKDDSIGGDTNEDGADTEPSSEDYWRVSLLGPGSSLEYVRVSYTSDGIQVENTLSKSAHITISESWGGMQIGAGTQVLDSIVMNNVTDALQINGGEVTIRNAELRGTGEGIGINISDATVSIMHSTTTAFAIGINVANAFNLALRDSVLKSNDTGFEINHIVLERGGNSTLLALNNSIVGNHEYGVNNKSFSTHDFSNNWWGSASGPTHEDNPGGNGDVVSNNVTYSPWLLAAPGEEPVMPICCSSVAFIPGIQSSHLYKQEVGEKELWIPNKNADVQKLFLTNVGESVDPAIFTRKIIGDVYGLQVYGEFVSYMNSLVADETIKAFKTLPYDWRFDVRDVVQRGVISGVNTISYTEQLATGTLPYMIKEIKSLAENSQNGKVTLITHSNGGLVVKELIKKLEEMKEAGEGNLIDSIDMIIMVAAPELGTPQGLASLLHGDGQTMALGLLLNAATARTFAENMPGAYGLLPSERFLSQTDGPLITFASSTDVVANFRQLFGNSIDSYSELKQFVSSGRPKPAPSAILTPNVLNQTLLTKAESLHSQDTWTAPVGVKLIKVIGWGVETVKGIQYEAKNGKILDHRPILTKAGDGTVVGSSHVENGAVYYLDLERYNNVTGTNNKHRDTLNSNPLLAFIKNRITGTTTLPHFISTDSPPSIIKRITIGIHSPAQIHLYTSANSHVGPTPTGAGDITRYEEKVPNGNYMEFGEGKYISAPESTYNVKVKGTGTGLFTLEIKNEDPTKNAEFKDIPVSSSTEAKLTLAPTSTTTELSIDNDGNGTVDYIIKNNTSLSPLVLATMLGGTIKNLHLPRLFEVILLSEIQLLKQYISANKPIQAKAVVAAMKLEITFERGKKIPASDADGLLLILQKIHSLL